MKALKYLFAALILISFFAGCKKTEEEIAPTLSINPAQKDIEANQGNFIIAISSTVKWTASSDKSWITLDPVSGTGDGTIQVDFELNTSASARTATVTFKGSNVADKTLTVTQSGVLPFLSVSPANQNVNAEQGNTTFAIASNTDWIVSSNQIWCTLSQASGKGNANLTASYIGNAMQTQRTATITITSQGLTDQIATVTQAAFVPSLFVTPANQNVGSPAGNTLFFVTANVEWNASSNQDWCTINTGGSGNGAINANFTENTTYQSRTAQITVSGSGVSDQVVSVTQSGSTIIQGLVAYYPFNGNTNDESGNGNNGTVWGATLTADRNGNLNSAYFFDGDNDWIQLTDFKAGTHFSISFWVNPFVTDNGQAFISKNNSAGGSPYNQNLFLIGYWDNGYSLHVNGNSYSSGTKITGWHHIVVLVDDLGTNSVQTRIYRNSILFAQNIFSTVVNIDNTNQHWAMGQEYDDYTLTDFFNGIIDDVRFYNRILTEQEIQQLYNE